MPWIATLVGAAASYYGNKRASDKANNQAKNLFGGTGYNMNPYIFSALGRSSPGFRDPASRQYVNPNSPFYQDLQKIVNGQNLSPYLLNQPLNQLNQGYNNNLQRFQSMVGRSNAGGGLAQAYGLANLAGRNNAIANLFQNYGQWREQQRRSDLDWIMNQQGQALDRARGVAAAQAPYMQVPMNWATGLGNTIASGLAAYGSQHGQQNYNGVTTPQVVNTTPINGNYGQSINWGNPAQWNT